ncbi:TspO/MBR family protein [Povalibacter sp.]|uniref:TspO/MBR family protein n=1 Tax=Povalibacter sp. TaxID=1962978 RepID=UPI002F421A75
MATLVLRRNQLPSLVVFILVVAAIAFFGAQFQPGFWFEQLAKPSWNPPGALFGPVWTVLYIAIAVAGWLVWRSAGRIVLSLQIWFAQLVLNGLWSFLFFGLHRPDLALVDILLLLALIVAFIVTARHRSPMASWLFVPYAAWVSFATALNFAIWRLNSA